MVSVYVDPGKVLEFKDGQSFYRWLGKNHHRESEVWIKIPMKYHIADSRCE